MALQNKILHLTLLVGVIGCADDSATGVTGGTGSETVGSEGDGDGDPLGDGDSGSSGDGDGDPAGDGDGDGDGDSSGDGDGDSSGDGDGDSSEDVCGDGIVANGEACDDGNADNSDGCIDSCELASCGDGFVWLDNEVCDDGNDDDSDDCLASCEPASCGDGFVWLDNEACDDGNDIDTDGCLSSCDAAACGDGLVWEGNEECDDGNVDNSDNCVETCESASCGDGFVWEGHENCEDGNLEDDDGCSASCSTELYFHCIDTGPGSCQPLRIMYLIANVDDANYRAAVSAITSGPVTDVNATDTTPSLDELQEGYDCVFTHPNDSYEDSEALGAILAEYVDGGGNVVLGVASAFDPPTGLASTLIMAEGYSPISTGGGVVAGSPTYSGDGVSVLYTNVGDYSLSVSDQSVVLQGDGVADGTLSNGEIATAFRPDFKVVYLNGTGHGPFSPSGDWDILLANACSAGHQLIMP